MMLRGSGLVDCRLSVGRGRIVIRLYQNVLPAASALPLTMGRRDRCLMLLHHREGDGGVKTEFCPGEAGFCPDWSGILSRCVSVLSRIALNIEAFIHCRENSSARCSREEGVKMEGDSGGDESLVRRVPVIADLPRASQRGKRIRAGGVSSRAGLHPR